MALFAELRDGGHVIVTVTHDEKLVAALADVRTTLAAPATNTTTNTTANTTADARGDARGDANGNANGNGDTGTRSAEATR